MDTRGSGLASTSQSPRRFIRCHPANWKLCSSSAKSTSTGEIVPVEPGEAEWTLDSLVGLFDFYFDEPAKTQVRRDALNTKLGDSGKPELRGSEPPPESVS